MSQVQTVQSSASVYGGEHDNTSLRAVPEYDTSPLSRSAYSVSTTPEDGRRDRPDCTQRSRELLYMEHSSRRR